MPQPFNTAIILGSIRKDSINRKVANAVIQLALPEFNLSILQIDHLPLYNPDLEESPPESWIRLRQQLREAQAYLFITPEHNRSIPAALKNAIDIGSRPPQENAWRRKPAAIITATPGSLGGFGANHHLRQSLTTLNVPTMPTPEAYLSHAHEFFDENGKLINESTKDFLVQFMLRFSKWVERNSAE